MMGQIVLSDGTVLNAHPTSWRMALDTLRAVAPLCEKVKGAAVIFDDEKRYYLFDKYRHVKRVTKEKYYRDEEV